VKRLRGRRTRIGQLALAAVYVTWALLCTFALGGGAIVLLFFAVWAAIWCGFGVFSSWADRTRRMILRDRGYY